MPEALARHDEILRDTVESHSGVVFKHTGDGICAAFQDPGDALDAALAGQAAMQAEVFDGIGGISVRMAIHTGNAEERLGDYRGPALNRVARLLDVAVGGDILLTDVAEDLLRAILPSEVELADLGEHRLRGISAPGHVYSVATETRGTPRRRAVSWLAALGATAVLAGAIAVFSVTGPPGTGTPETTVAAGEPTTAPSSPSTTVAIGPPGAKWAVTPGGATVSLAGHDGVVFGAGRATGLHAYRVEDAAVVWPEPGLVVDADQPLSESFGAPIAGTPVVGAGLVFYSTFLGSLHAVELESGELRWWHRFEDCSGDTCSPVVPSQPVVTDDAVIVAAGSDLYRFSASSGEFVQVDTGLGSVTAGPTLGRDSVYVAEGASLLQFSTDDLTLRRSLSLGEGAPVGYQAAVASIVVESLPSESGLGFDDGVFIVDAERFLTRLSLETASLHPSWSVATDAAFGVEVATVPVVGPGFDGRDAPTLWAVDSIGLLIGIDAGNGGQVASHKVGPTTHAVVVGEDGIVYVATDTPELIGCDPVLESLTIREPLLVAPHAAPIELAGRVFVAGVDGTIRGYGPGGEIGLPSPPVAPGLIDGSISSVAWSANGDMAFEHGGDVWLAGSGGGEIVNLTRLSGGGSAPAWSSDGTMLAYTSGSVGSDVYVIRPDGSGRRNLSVTTEEDEHDPAWSPDGSRIVYSSQACADQGGLEPERVCSGISALGWVDPIIGRTGAFIGAPTVLASDSQPDWSPTGNLIAFASDRSVEGSPEESELHLWTMTRAGTDVKPILDPGPIGGRAPVFSPDGKRLAFVSDGGPGGVAALSILDLETGGTTPIKDLPVGAGAPTWSSDGTKLAFAWELSTLGKIYTVSVGD